MSKNFENKISYIDTIDLIGFFRPIVFNLYRIAFVVLIFIILWVIYISNATRIYEAQSLIQVSNNKNNNLESIIGKNEAIDLNEYIAIYKARSNLMEVVNRLKLDVLINNKKTPKVDGIDIEIFDAKFFDKSNSFSLNIKKVSDGYNVIDNEGNLIIENAKLGVLSSSKSSDGIEFNLKINSLELDNYMITVVRKGRAVEELHSSIQVDRFIPKSRLTFGQGGSLLKVSLKNSDIEYAKTIIDTTNDVFFQKSIEQNSAEASKSIEFIDNRLEDLKSIIQKDQERLNRLKKLSSTYDVDLDAEVIYDQLKSLEEGIKNILLKEAEYSRLYNKSNPLYINIIEQKEVLIGRRNEINKKISNLPEVQQDYINSLRDIEVSEEIYAELLNKKIEFSISAASTLGNIRIIDKAHFVQRVSPEIFKSFIQMIIISLIIGIAYSYIRQYFFSKISLPSDITDEFPDLQIIGVIPDEDSNINGSGVYKEALKSLAVNVQLSQDDDKKCSVILVVGAVKGVGKTFSSYNLANTLADIGHKTLILDCDYKQGDIHINTNQKKLKDIKLFIDNSERDYEEFLIRKNFYSIPRPSNFSKDSINLFSSSEYRKFLEDAKNNFDYIVLDTPPILAISDSLILSQYSDIVLPVIRHEESTIVDFKRLLSEFSSINKNIDYFIYNGFKKPSGYYGYDYYSYKYYGGNYEYSQIDD